MVGWTKAELLERMFQRKRTSTAESSADYFETHIGVYETKSVM